MPKRSSKSTVIRTRGPGWLSKVARSHPRVAPERQSSSGLYSTYSKILNALKTKGRCKSILLLLCTLNQIREEGRQGSEGGDAYWFD